MTDKKKAQRGTERSKPLHTITPTEAEFIMAIWRHQRDHHEGASAEQLKETMDSSVGMIRKLAMRLSKTTPKYVDRIIKSQRRTVGGVEKTVSFTVYHLTENVFGKWPRTGTFLLEAKRFKQDENRTVSIDEFKEYLKKHHGYTDAMFEEDWVYFLARNYIHQYGDRFTPGIKIDAEEQYLLLMREEYVALRKANHAKPRKKRD